MNKSELEHAANESAREFYLQLKGFKTLTPFQKNLKKSMDNVFEKTALQETSTRLPNKVNLR